MSGGLRARPDLARAGLVGPLAVAAIAALAGWIAWRNSGLYPVVFSDEYTYSTSARFRAFGDATIPGYVYLALYRSTQWCGDGFLDCARALNVVFFVAAAPFIYAVARRVLSHGLSLAVCVLSIASPFNTFTIYFMPESLYFFGFWVVTWQAMRLDADSGRRGWLLLGAAVGLLMLVKPHAMFLLPALAVYGAVIVGGRDGPSAVRLARFAKPVGALVAGAFVVRFGIGFALAGPDGIDPFGAFYSGIARHAVETGGGLGTFVADTVFSLRGHALALLLLFALPLAMAGPAAMSLRHPSTGDARWRIGLLTLLLFVSLLAMAAAFTASVTGAGPYETASRMHQRYYDFAFPLLLIVGGMAATSPVAGRARRWPIAVACVALVVHVALGGLAPYAVELADAPELFGAATRPATRRALAAAAIVSLLLWCWRPRAAALFFVWCLVPWMFWKGQVAAGARLDPLHVPGLYDRAGLETRRVLGAEDARTVCVFGSDASGVYRALFHLGNATATWTLVDEGAPIATSAWTDDAWALVVGDHPLEAADAVRHRFDGFVLAHRSTDRPTPGSRTAVP